MFTEMPGKSCTNPSTRFFSCSIDCVSYRRPERHTSRPTTFTAMLVTFERFRKSLTSSPICAVEYDTCVTIRAASIFFASSTRWSVFTFAVAPFTTTLSPTIVIEISGSSENMLLSTSQ